MQFQKAIEYLGPYQLPLMRLDPQIRREISDIRLYRDRPVLLTGRTFFGYPDGQGKLHKSPNPDVPVVSGAELEKIFHRMCGYAVYSHTEEIRRGYIAADGWLRVGLVGALTAENGCVRSMRELTGLCIRIPREVRGFADPILQRNPELSGGLLIAGAPSAGKTTLLRDLARQLGNRGSRVVVLDERYEIFFHGLDLGLGTAVLQGCPKPAGFTHALRCLSPEYILCDELDDRDLPAVQAAAHAGVTLCATVHAGSVQDLLSRPVCRALLESGAFSHTALLRDRTIQLLETENLLERDSGFSAHHSGTCRGIHGSGAASVARA